MTADRVSRFLGLLLAIPFGLLGLAGVVVSVAVGRPSDLRLAREGRPAAAVVIETRRSYTINVGRIINSTPAAARVRILDGPWTGRDLDIEAGYAKGQSVALTCLPDRFLCQSVASLDEELAQWPAPPTLVISAILLAGGGAGCVWAWRSRA